MVDIALKIVCCWHSQFSIGLLSFILQCIFPLLHLIERFVVLVYNLFVLFNFLSDFLEADESQCINTMYKFCGPARMISEVRKYCLTVIWTSSVASFFWSFSRSSRNLRICSSLSLIALFRDFSSLEIQRSLSSLEVNWFPLPCFAYSSFLRCSARANLYHIG